MKKTIYNLFVLIAIACCSGCTRKSYEESVTDEPLFKINGKINGQTIQIASGQNGQQITSSKKTDEFGYPQYISQFAPSDCSDCGPSFTFILRDDYRVVDNNDSSSILSASQIPFMYNPPENNGLTYLLQADNLESYFCEWISDENPIGNGNNIIYTCAESGFQEVSMRLHRKGEIQYIVTATVDAGSPYSISAPFKIEMSNGGQWRLKPSATLPDYLLSTQWEINGNQLAPHDIDVMPNEGQVIRMNYHSSISNQSGYYQIEILEDNFSTLPPKLNVFFKGEHEQRELFILEYIDNNGRKYNSINNVNIHRSATLTHLGQSADAIQGGPSELRMLRFDADLYAEDDTTVKLELRDFQVTTGFRP